VSRIAVVGSGISGLAAAWLLSRQHNVILFEADDRLGGHTHTHHIDTPDGALALDTGFLVHNDRTYPRLVRLFEELGVACLDSDMSFGVTSRDPDFEYSTRNMNGLFAQRSNLLRPGHYAFLLEVVRFNRAIQALVRSAEDIAGAATPGALTLDEFFREHHFSGQVLDRFVLPLASAIWSASVTTIRRFPALTLARFFDQHGMNTTLDHPTWRVVAGGSASYIPKLVASPRIETRLGARVVSVRRDETGVDVSIRGEAPIRVDEIVFACHGDAVLPILADATDTERDILSAFRTVPNEAVLHTDASWLPRRRAARASWNYLIGGPGTAATVTYHLNRLQRLPARAEYCVTLNPAAAIEPYYVLRRMAYTHPMYTIDAIRAQARWPEISGTGRTHYCGAYWFYGFHEDGLRSAIRVAERLGVHW
jgi:predicted NAD/FAD-binding protein